MGKIISAFVSPVLVWALFSIFFLFGLLSSKLANLSFYGLILVALLYFAGLQWRTNSAMKHAWKRCGWVYLAAAAIAAVIFFREIKFGELHIRSYDNASRIALLAVLTWVALLQPSAAIKNLRWIFLLGSLAATIKLAILSNYGQERVAVIGYVPVIAYSELALLMSVFALMSVALEQKKTVWCYWVAASAIVIGLYNIYISQTRGAWIAIPVFIVLVRMLFSRNTRPAKLILQSLFIFIVLGAAASTTKIVQNRLGQAFNDLKQFDTRSDLDTSLGTRLQLWHGSWILFKENMLFGVGENGFPAALHDLKERGVITDDAAKFPHSHNEIIFKMATFGIFGLFGILATYIVPFIYFIRSAYHVDQEIKVAAYMGMALCLGYFMFGLVDVMFMWRVCNIFYAMALAIFLAVIVRRQNELISP